MGAKETLESIPNAKDQALVLRAVFLKYYQSNKSKELLKMIEELNQYILEYESNESSKFQNSNPKN